MEWWQVKEGGERNGGRKGDQESRGGKGEEESGGTPRDEVVRRNRKTSGKSGRTNERFKGQLSCNYTDEEKCADLKIICRRLSERFSALPASSAHTPVAQI